MFFRNRRVLFIGYILCCAIILSACKGKVSEPDIMKSKSDVQADNEQNSNSMQDTPTPVDSMEGNDSGTKNTMTDTYAKAYEKSGVLPSLKEVYKDRFRVGVSLSKMDIENKEKAVLVAEQFNSITCENEMKPDFILDRAATLAAGDEECPVISMKNAETALKFAKENGLNMRGHTLVWHSQTPRWFFTKGYDNAADAPFVSKEVMLKRMENYIREVMEYVNPNYPGVVYAWDVVNEAIEPGDGQVDKIRTKDNLWYQVIGEDYIEYAFTFARKYADPEQKLFYNDYGTYDKVKLFPIYDLIKKLKEKNIIDGIGMQDHITIDNPTILDYQYTINKYSELGIEIQVTELDINNTDASKEAQQKLATRYKWIMTILQNCVDKKKANITSVTLWGLTDDRSWLNTEDKPNYPLLFDKDLKPKPAYFGFLQDDSMTAY